MRLRTNAVLTCTFLSYASCSTSLRQMPASTFQRKQRHREPEPDPLRALTRTPRAQHRDGRTRPSKVGSGRPSMPVPALALALLFGILRGCNMVFMNPDREDSGCARSAREAQTCLV